MEHTTSARFIIRKNGTVAGIFTDASGRKTCHKFKSEAEARNAAAYANSECVEWRLGYPLTAEQIAKGLRVKVSRSPRH